MHNIIRQYARRVIKFNIDQCDVEQKEFFMRLHSPDDLNIYTSEVVDNLTDAELEIELNQITASAERSECKYLTPEDKLSGDIKECINDFMVMQEKKKYLSCFESGFKDGVEHCSDVLKKIHSNYLTQ